MRIETKSTYSLILNEEEKDLLCSILNYVEEENINQDLYQLLEELVNNLRCY